MPQLPDFGPYKTWPSIAAFDTLAQDAHALFEHDAQLNQAKLRTPAHHLLQRIVWQAKMTSLGVRLNNTWLLNLAALALLRVRLEQTIVCSYLLHEEQDVALIPFIRFTPVADHRTIKAALQDETLAEQLAVFLDAEKVEAIARRAEAELSGSAISEGAFQRNWTALDLRSMAKRRDTLARPKGGLYSLSLEREYLTIYKTASSIVHADCASLSFRYVDLFPSATGELVLMPLPIWALIVSASLAHYDILQCFEVAHWLEIGIEADYRALMEKWLQARDRYVNATARGTDAAAS